MDNSYEKPNALKSSSSEKPIIVLLFAVFLGLLLVGSTIYSHFAPLSDDAKKEIIEREVYLNIYRIEGESVKFKADFNNTLQLTNKNGEKVAMTWISDLPSKELEKICSVDLNKDQVGLIEKGNTLISPTWGITDSNIKNHIKNCIDDFASKTPLPDIDVLFMLSDPRIAKNTSYAPLKEQFELFKQQETPTYASAYKVYDLLNNAYSANFDKSLNKIKTTGTKD